MGNYSLPVSPAHVQQIGLIWSDAPITKNLLN